MNALISKILNDPTPTTDARSERHLAVALGYPSTWRVRRVRQTVAENLVVPQDVIYAGNPNKGVDRWYCHEAAQLAATQFVPGNPYQFKGGHLTKQVPKFQKGDVIEVKYGRKWYAAKISKRKEALDGIKYSVVYTEDESTQENVREVNIRLAPPDNAALELAGKMGLPAGWKATANNKKYIFTSPEGEVFRNKKAALDHVATTAVDGEDPPWRTAGHELIGRSILYQHDHKLSGMRSVSIDQIGKVTGWISETDTDRYGEPGYVSEVTNKPASLFHIVFQDVPGHPYMKYLLDFQDMEEGEVLKYLLEEGGPPAKKRARIG